MKERIMKLKNIALSSILFLGIATSSQAFWNSNNWNNGWGNNFANNNWGWDYNPYDVWDPRYWAEEMEDMFDGNDWWDNNNGYHNSMPYQNNLEMMRMMQSPYQYMNSPTDNKLLPKFNPYLR